MFPPDVVVLRGCGGLLAGYALYFASWFQPAKPRWLRDWVLPLVGFVGVLFIYVSAAIAGFYGLRLLGSTFLANLPEIASGVLLGVSGVLAVWAANIGAQAVANLARMRLGQKTQPIEWVRNSGKPYGKRHRG